jgi:hypothetical protein
VKTKAKRQKPLRREWTAADLIDLKKHSKARTPVAKISREMKGAISAEVYVQRERRRTADSIQLHSIKA